MRCRDIGCLVAPDRPSSERNLADNQRDPQDRESLKRCKTRRISPNAKSERDHSNRDNEREKSVRHLQPDLECGHIR